MARISRQTRLKLLVAAVLLVVVVLDQLLKLFVKTHFTLGECLLMGGLEWAQLLFVENKGMAFGMEFIDTFGLCCFRLIVIGFLCYWFWRTFSLGLATGFYICAGLVLAGACGNLIDNIAYGCIFTESTRYSTAVLVPWGGGYGSLCAGHVVDMFHFPVIDVTFPYDWPWIGGYNFVFFSPIFNLADAAITCGGLAALIFYRKSLEHAFALLNLSKHKQD